LWAKSPTSKKARLTIPARSSGISQSSSSRKSLEPIGQPTDINGNGGYIAIRTTTEPEQMANALRAAVRSIDPQLPLSQMQNMERAVSDSEAPRGFNTAIISAFAFAAVLLAVLGIYSVIAFWLRCASRRWPYGWPWDRSAQGFCGWFSPQPQSSPDRLRDWIAGRSCCFQTAARPALQRESI
jgi:hypothetical protein